MAYRIDNPAVIKLNCIYCKFAVFYPEYVACQRDLAPQFAFHHSKVCISGKSGRPDTGNVEQLRMDFGRKPW